MSFLESYTQRTYETRGLLHQRNLEVLRNYLNTTPVDQLIEAILNLTRIEQLKTLWEAGLTKSLQEATLQRYTELTGRRG